MSWGGVWSRGQQCSVQEGQSHGDLYEVSWAMSFLTSTWTQVADKVREGIKNRHQAHDAETRVGRLGVDPQGRDGLGIKHVTLGDL